MKRRMILIGALMAILALAIPVSAGGGKKGSSTTTTVDETTTTVAEVTTTTVAETTTTEAEGKVEITPTCELVVVLNNSDETVFSGHSVPEGDIWEVKPGQTLELPGAPGIDWYVYSKTRGFLQKGTFVECEETTSTTVEDGSTTVPESSSTVDPEDNDDPSPEVTEPTPLPVVVPDDDPNDPAPDPEDLEELPFTGPLAIVSAILLGSAFIGGGVTLLRKGRKEDE